MAILVTGGAGYIGSHVGVSLLNAGEDIVVADNFSNSKREVIPAIREITHKEFKFYECDICNPSQLDFIFAENDIEAVIHLAGYKAVGESVKDPLKYWFNNVSGTVVLFGAMKRYNCRRFVFSSSACVYGADCPIPYREDYRRAAINPYGNTKLAVENMCADFCGSDDEASFVLLRYFNPIGAHESGKISENPNGIPNNVMPAIIKAARGGIDKDKLRVFGGDYPTVDGTAVRDYLHVCDLAEGHVRAVLKARDTRGVRAYNLGTGKGYSVLQVIAAFEKANGVKVPYEIIERRAGDLAEYYADPSKANTELNWKAERTLEQMCAGLMKSSES